MQAGRAWAELLRSVAAELHVPSSARHVFCQGIYQINVFIGHLHTGRLSVERLSVDG